MKLKDIAIGTITYPLTTVQDDEVATRDIQSRLLSWGYKPGVADGDWGSKTTAAYVLFATEYGYPKDAFTPRSAAHLVSLAFRSLQDIAKQPTTFTLSSIRDNPLIAKAVQTQLLALSYQPGIADGLWGKGTQAAFAAFAQANQHLSDRLSPKAATQLLNIPVIKTDDVKTDDVKTDDVKTDDVKTDKKLPESEIPEAGVTVILPVSLTTIRQGQIRWPLGRLSQSPALVEEIQQCLDALGHQPGPIDGQWGDRSRLGYETIAQVFARNPTSISPRMAKLLLEPEVPSIPSLARPPILIPADYKTAAKNVGSDVATIQAVAEVEAAGSGFFEDGRPKILLEAHWFSAFTDGRYDFSNPDVSSPVWNRRLYIGGVGEWDRLYKALRLDRTAALKSTSWGLGQIMGFNHVDAGYRDVESFVLDMHQSEGKQLTAMFNFIKANGLGGFLATRDWAGFAQRYNGEGYRVNQYDTKLASAYDYWRNQSIG
jgi:peptidoglycan hydrolase-like protein with peptidoglycan-binding domain